MLGVWETELWGVNPFYQIEGIMKLLLWHPNEKMPKFLFQYHLEKNTNPLGKNFVQICRALTSNTTLRIVSITGFTPPSLKIVFAEKVIFSQRIFDENPKTVLPQNAWISVFLQIAQTYGRASCNSLPFFYFLTFEKADDCTIFAQLVAWLVGWLVSPY